ncbi:MAG TPA: 30S ribosomal protein S13 [Candidatus Woesebacteria bacterium]|jgi:small subunit ribosomal protein S13|nr:30S ribosomal protein S13 [Candidatus Woesebacteria bacterium]
MPRILGIDIPDRKKTLFSLTSIYGVGRKRSGNILSEANVDPDKRASELTTHELSRIQRALERFRLEGDLRRQVVDNIDRLIRVRSYRGLRHQAKLPSRGQRTRTNARTARGGSKRRTVGSISKEQAAKTETKDK